MRPREAILRELESYWGSKQGDSIALKAILEALLDLREILGVEVYLGEPAKVPETKPFNPPSLYPRAPRLPTGPKAPAPRESPS
jgi:hypothetical protein